MNARLEDIRNRIKIDAKTGTITLPIADVSYLMSETELRHDDAESEICGKCQQTRRQHLGRGASVPLELTGYYVNDHHFEKQP